MVPFLASLLVTVALLGAVLATGLRRRRGAHYACVAAFFASLGVTIWRAEVMGASNGGLRFEAAATAQLLHRIAVALTFVLVPVLLVTGVRLARAPQAAQAARRVLHRRVAMAFIAGVVASALLGSVMTWQAVAATG